MRDAIIYILIGVVIGVLSYYFIAHYSGCDKEASETTIVPDTKIEYRYITELGKDTTKPWYKIRWKESEPEIIYQDKVDSQFFETIKYFPSILKGRKERGQFRVFALSREDSVLQEYVFEDVGRDFVFASESKGIYVKSQKIYFNSPYVEINRTQPIFVGTKLKDGSLGVSVGTDVSYMDKVTLGIELNYQNVQEDRVNGKIKLRYYPFRN